jgi:hypothetical protein
MAGFSRRRREIGAVIAAVLAVTGAVLLLDRSVARPLTPERAREALAEHFPELRNAPICYSGDMTGGDFLDEHLPELRYAPIAEHKVGIEVAVCSCDVSFDRGKWSGTWSYTTAPRGRYGSQTISGEFRRSPFGRWEAVETERFVQVSGLCYPSWE